MQGTQQAIPNLGHPLLSMEVLSLLGVLTMKGVIPLNLVERKELRFFELDPQNCFRDGDCLMSPTKSPTTMPTDEPSNAPTHTNPPTDAPTNPPTNAQTNPPTDAPTNPPTDVPTESSH